MKSVHSKTIRKEYAKKFAAHKSKAPCDVPIEIFHSTGKKKKVSLNGLVMKHRVVLVSNVAVRCSLAKDHYDGFQELAQEFGKKDFFMLLMPAPDFQGLNGNDDNEPKNINKTVGEKYDLVDNKFSFSEKVLVNADEATHPII